MLFLFFACRARQARKKSIKERVETLFNWRGKQMPSGGTDQQLPPYLGDQLDQVSPYPVNFAERVQSFFPECKYFLDLPHNHLFA